MFLEALIAVSCSNLGEPCKKATYAAAEQSGVKTNITLLEKKGYRMVKDTAEEMVPGVTKLIPAITYAAGAIQKRSITFPVGKNLEVTAGATGGSIRLKIGF